MDEQTTLPKGLLLVGLGAGGPELLTRQAWAILQRAELIFLRTRRHPALEHFPDAERLQSFDHLYEQASDFETVYQEIVGMLLQELARRDTVVYAVPGHPLIAETTGPELLLRCREQGIPVQVVSGLSFVDAVCTALNLDLFPQTSLADAFEIAAGHVPPFPVDQPALIAQIHSRQMASEVKLSLMSVYPDEHPVRLVHAAGTPEEVVESLPLYEIDRSAKIGMLTSLYLPAQESPRSFESLHEIMSRLRDPEGGCPWDREQTHVSLRPYLLEETYEVLEALDRGDSEKLVEELGDLLFQVIFHTVIAEEAGDFTLPEVVGGIARKLIRRHPHVFGDLEIDAVEEVLENWDRIKAGEREGNGQAGGSRLDGIPAALPALSQAAAMQRRASRAGFEWPALGGVYEKIQEEIEELRIAESEEERAAELGDLFFALAHLANWYRLDPEDALRQANQRFRKRFGYVEAQVAGLGVPMADLPLETLNQFWEQAKRNN